MKTSLNSFNTQQQLQINGQSYRYFDLNIAAKNGINDIHRLPFSLKVLLENLLRHEDGKTVSRDDIIAISTWLKNKTSNHEICFYPSRVLMQDFTGVPAIVDLAAMRDALPKLNKDPQKINPFIPVDLIIDHSVQVDGYGGIQAFQQNVTREFERNKERYQFLHWGQKAFNNFRVVPPGTGICHQVNLEYLAEVIWSQAHEHDIEVYPDTLVGTDSHTTMINGLAVLGWGVGGIEAEAVMLGQPYSMLIPDVVGVKLTGHLKEGVSATDLVLMVTEMLRKQGVVGKFVEFYGPGLSHLSLPDRATIANMAPEYGATCGFFPIDEETINYLRLSGRNEDKIALVETYAKLQGFWHDPTDQDKVYSSELKLDLSIIEPSLAGPKRPQDRVALSKLPEVFAQVLATSTRTVDKNDQSYFRDSSIHLQNGDVVIAAITSCTNTSNPSVMLAAGLLAKNAISKGMKVQPWVKSSLAPGSKVVTEYLAKAGLQNYLDQLGFNLVGYGCTTCIGNSGPLLDPIEEEIKNKQLMVSAVLSGNRNFEGRIHPLVEANWLASPPLVVAFALVGHTRINLLTEPMGMDTHNQPIYLKDIWPSNAEIAEAMQCISGDMFKREYADVFHGDEIWRSLESHSSQTYSWNDHSTYIQNPPYFTELSSALPSQQIIHKARILALLGDSITTDHISPAGSIKATSPAGLYLLAHNVPVQEFNSYGARRGNHEVMMRGTFANIRIRNEMVPGVEGGVTKNLLTNEVMSIYEAAMAYQKEQIPLVIVGGKEYGTGSSRDWAAKGTLLLGVKAVIAESFERIHRGNLIGMGVLPLQFPDGVTRKTLALTGNEFVSVEIPLEIKPKMHVHVCFENETGEKKEMQAICRIDTLREAEYYHQGGIMPYVLRRIPS